MPTTASSGRPSGKLGQAIHAEFGGFEIFQQKFTDAAMEHFGSGWTFLVQDLDGRLSIKNYPNQDSPISDRLKPLMLVDLWEHAYYLKWKNRKAEWIESWWKMVNWPEVEKAYVEEPAWMAARAAEG
jgi:Fe-Mn family superoxide dismutase